MFRPLPLEIYLEIAKVSEPPVQAALSVSNKQLHSLCTRVLYQHNVQYENSSAIAYAVTRYDDQDTILRVIRKTLLAGGNIRTPVDCTLRRHDYRITIRKADALFAAATRGLQEVVSFILRDKLIAVDSSSYGYPYTPLFISLYARQPHIGRMLIDYGASLCNPTCNALHCAAQENLVELALFLVREKGQDVDELCGGVTPLVYAIKGSPDACPPDKEDAMVSCLLDLGARVDQPSRIPIAFQVGNQTPLSIAIQYGKFKIATLLLRRGACPGQGNVPKPELALELLRGSAPRNDEEKEVFDFSTLLIQQLSLTPNAPRTVEALVEGAVDRESRALEDLMDYICRPSRTYPRILHALLCSGVQVPERTQSFMVSACRCWFEWRSFDIFTVAFLLLPYVEPELVREVPPALIWAIQSRVQQKFPHLDSVQKSKVLNSWDIIKGWQISQKDKRGFIDI